MESKAASPRKVFGCISGCFWKKSIKTGSSALESASDLSSSGESDFFPTTISGWAWIYCKSNKKSCLNRVNLEPSGTTSKPQKSRSSWEYFKNTIRSVSVVLEKMRWSRRALSIEKSLCLRGLPILAWKWETKERGTISSRLMASSRRERNRYLSLSNLFWQSSKISAKVSCLYVIV